MYVSPLFQTLLLKSPGPCGWLEIHTIFINLVVSLEADEAYVNLGCDSGLCDGLSTPLPLLPGTRMFGYLRWSQRQQIPRASPVRYVIYDPLPPR
jgi:hypothetical protein